MGNIKTWLTISPRASSHDQGIRYILSFAVRDLAKRDHLVETFILMSGLTLVIERSSVSAI